MICLLCSLLNVPMVDEYGPLVIHRRVGLNFCTPNSTLFFYTPTIVLVVSSVR